MSKWRSALGRDGLASSINLLLPDALATGKLDIVQNAIVREISVDKNTGLANGAHFVDRHSGREMHVKARAVVLAAGCLESTRLLLNSKIGNSSGVMGHYLVDQMYGVSVVASVPEARDGKAPPGLMGGSAFIPRFRNLSKDKKSNFIKGYCVRHQQRRERQCATISRFMAPSCRRKLDSYANSCVSGSIFGERVALYENHVRIDPECNGSMGHSGAAY